MESEQCGCFYCLTVFPPSEIEEWVDADEHEIRQTALCPNCGIDSVIGSKSGYPMTKEFLQTMEEHWFSAASLSSTAQEGATQNHTLGQIAMASRTTKIMTQHDNPPEYIEVLSELRKKFDQLGDPPYWQYLQPLKALVVDRTVLSSEAGNSGFILFLDDGTWVLSYVDDRVLKWLTGAGQPSKEQRHLMHSPAYGDGTLPLAVDLPYADESCHIALELAHAHGQCVSALAFGEDCFNFCFPDGHELETMIIPTNEGKTALRVFWEQW